MQAEPEHGAGLGVGDARRTEQADRVVALQAAEFTVDHHVGEGVAASVVGPRPVRARGARFDRPAAPRGAVAGGDQLVAGDDAADDGRLPCVGVVIGPARELAVADAPRGGAVFVVAEVQPQATAGHRLHAELMFLAALRDGEELLVDLGVGEAAGGAGVEHGAGEVQSAALPLLEQDEQVVREVDPTQRVRRLLESPAEHVDRIVGVV